MEQSDLPDILDIENKCHPFPWSEGIFRDCFKVGYGCWVLEEAKEIKGFFIITLGPEECHILNICVAPEYQGQGLGHLQMEFIINHLKQHHDMKSLFLEVRESNISAISLYQKLGFNEIGERKNYYPAHNGRENAIMLALELT